MPDWPDYELIDFGVDKRRQGRRLERFGSLLLDRPCPAADELKKQTLDAWGEAIAKYDGARATDGQWVLKKGKPSPKKWYDNQFCSIPIENAADGEGFSLSITPTPAGQVGMFPEQFANWQWIAQQVTKHRKITPNKPIRVLNLFGYTGGSTLAAACAGAEVTHVDASKPSVALARENVERSGLADRPIRWIVEDAVRYCTREVKRGSQYEGIILDPPSYGHGPKGEAWRLERDLPKLLELCKELTRESRLFFLTTCHTPGIGPAELSAYLSDAIVGHCGQPPKSGNLWLKTATGRKLESGVYARWPS